VGLAAPCYAGLRPNHRWWFVTEAKRRVYLMMPEGLLRYEPAYEYRGFEAHTLHNQKSHPIGWLFWLYGGEGRRAPAQARWRKATTLIKVESHPLQNEKRSPYWLFYWWDWRRPATQVFAQTTAGGLLPKRSVGYT